MANSPQTQAYLKALGEALIPVLEKLKAGYGVSAFRDLPSGDILELVSRHSQKLLHVASQLHGAIDGLVASIEERAGFVSLHLQVNHLERPRFNSLVQP